jgi:Putative lumazine-binding
LPQIAGKKPRWQHHTDASTVARVEWSARAGKLLVAACLAGTMLGACGGSHRSTPAGSDTQQIRQVVRSYLTAQTQGDAQTACSLLTPDGQRQLEALVVKRAKGLIASRPSCTDAVSLVHSFAGAKLLNALGTARIGTVRVQGDTATAQVTDGTEFAPQAVTLAKIAGAWRIAGVPGLGG